MDNPNIAIVSAPNAVTLGGQTYLISPPTEKDAFAVFQNAKKQALKHYNPIREAMDAMKDIPCTDEQRTAILLQAHRVQAAKEIPIDTVSEYLMSAKGAAFYLWILARKNHPELTLEKAESIITEDAAVSVWADLDEASGVNLIHNNMEASGFFRPLAAEPTG